MPRTDAKFAYTDCYSIMDKALLDGEGVRVGRNSESEAMTLRHRLNYARVLDRQNNAKVYPPEHPMFGQSEYDKLQCTIRATNLEVWPDAPSPWWVYVTHVKMPEIVEGLSERAAE